MKTFTEYLKEAVTEGAAFEEFIIAAWNKETLPDLDSVDAASANGIIDYLKHNGVSGHASKLPHGPNVTSDWSKFWKPDNVPGSTKTPKTDIVIGKHKISVKKGAAQLMSGGKNESKATFYAAVQNAGIQDELILNIQSKLDLLTQSSISAGEVAKEIKKNEDSILQKANEVNNEVKELMRKAFANNKEFRRAFVSEAMTGDVKFGNTSSASAEYVLATDGKGYHPQLHKTIDAQFLDKIATKTAVTVRFKSTSVKSKGVKTGQYRYWSVVSLGVNKLDEEIYNYKGVLTESVISSLFARVKIFMMNLFNKAVEWMKQSIQNVVEFFELNPQISLNNTISF